MRIDSGKQGSAMTAKETMKLITVKLPDDLEKKLAELRGEKPRAGDYGTVRRSINAVIVEALRAQWFPSLEDRLCGIPIEIIGLEPHIAETYGGIERTAEYPTYGSIPAEKRNG